MKEAVGVCKHLTRKVSDTSDFPFSEDTNILLNELQFWCVLIFFLNPRTRVQL